MLKLYHAEPMANSLKCLIPVHEKGLAFESHYVNLHLFEQHSDAFLRINPEGRVPVLVHDGAVITQSTVINEYLEDAFPDTPPLRPGDALGKALMRTWNKFIDEQLMNYVSIHGWNRRIAIVARGFSEDEFERLMARIPLLEQREKWRTARRGFPEAELANATRKVILAADHAEAQLSRTPWLAGSAFTLADVNFFAHFGGLMQRLFPELATETRYPRIFEWAGKVKARPGVAAALAMPNHTRV